MSQNHLQIREGFCNLCKAFWRSIGLRLAHWRPVCVSYRYHDSLLALRVPDWGAAKLKML